MASKTLSSAIFILSLILLSTVSHACNACTPTPKPCQAPPPASTGSCPRDALKLAVCADILGLVNVVVGSPPTQPCCSLLKGLVDLEAALCLCTAIKANVLGINLNVPVTLSLLLSACQKEVPSGFKCA